MSDQTWWRGGVSVPDKVEVMGEPRLPDPCANCQQPIGRVAVVLGSGYQCCSGRCASEVKRREREMVKAMRRAE